VHEPSKRRAWRILAVIAVLAGLIAVLPGTAIGRGSLDGGASRATQHPPDDAMAASGNPLWNRTWLSDGRAKALWCDDAGNVFTCGYTESFGSGESDMVLVKWDAAGNQLWNRTWGGVDVDLGYAVWGDDAGNIYTCGSTYSFCPGNYDMVLVKWNGSGQVLWFSILWGLPDDHASAVWGDGAGSIYVCGYSRFNTPYNDMVLAKWDVAGNLLWRQTWGEAASDDYAHAVWGDGAGNIYTCGEADGPYTGYCDMVLVQWDVAGNVLWNSTRGSTYVLGSGAWGDSAGNVYTCGSTCSSDAGWGILLVKWMGSSLSQPQPQPQGVVMIVVFVVAAFIALAACMLAIIIRTCGLQAARPARQNKSDRSNWRVVRLCWSHSIRRSGRIQ
jgi:hypothetical protein